MVKVKDDRLSDEDEIIEEEEEEIPHDAVENKGNIDDIPQWPQNDMMELFSRIEAQIPANDNLSFGTRAERLEWDDVGHLRRCTKNFGSLSCYP